MSGSTKEKYKKACEQNSIPLFAQDWWLDAVCGEHGWDVIVLEKGGRVVATLPFTYRRRFGLTVLGMPPLTQTLGPWIKYPTSQKLGKKYSLEKDVLSDLIGRLPVSSGFSENFNSDFTNWLPFYWNGFNQTTNYTYVLDDISDTDEVWAGFLENIRTDIRKAEKIVKCIEDPNFDTFWQCHVKVFSRQDIHVPYDESLARRLDDAARQRERRKIFLAVDELGRVHAGVYIVWDSERAYYLMGAGDPELRSSGATSFLIWKAIQFASSVTKSFDFEGSMIEPIERFFRGFGARQVPYFRVSRYGKAITIANAAKQILQSFTK